MPQVITPSRPAVVVTGAGIVSAIGCDLSAFAEALRAGQSGVRVLRSSEVSLIDGLPAALLQGPLGARGDELACRLPAANAQRFTKQTRRAPLAIHAAAVSVAEAWLGARLDDRKVAPEDVAIVVGGHNIAQNLQYLRSREFGVDSAEYVPPSHALNFMDGFIVGVLSEVFDVRGEGFTCGAASASGSVAIVQALRLLQEGRARVCLVVGALAELSPIELAAFWNVGALGGRALRAQPEQVSRPFDRAREGFVYGQASGCLVLESSESARERAREPLVELAGGAVALHGTSRTEPSVEGELRAMRLALADAQVSAGQVDYVNAHGTSSALGDEVEMEALDALFASEVRTPWVNSTKSLTGHCLWSAGTVEAISTLVQLRGGFVHPNLNLEEPIASRVRLAPRTSTESPIEVALSNSFGFGGFNSSIVMRKLHAASEKSAL